MAHNITDTDGAVFHKQAAWHGLGLVIQEDMSPTQAMELAGLNWEVELTGPVMAGDALTDDYKAVIRKDTNTILSIQSPDYKPVQNHEVFDLAYNLGDDIKVESALSMQGGRRLVVLCKTGTMDAGNANDPVEQYMALISSHDGTLATQGLPTSVRIVCQNTLSQAMAAGADVVNEVAIVKLQEKADPNSPPIFGKVNARGGNKWINGKTLSITNNDKGQISIAIDVNYPNGLRWFRLSESSFTMEPGASKDIQLNIDESSVSGKDSRKKTFGWSGSTDYKGGELKVSVTKSDKSTKSKSYEMKLTKNHPDSY